MTLDSEHFDPTPPAPSDELLDLILRMCEGGANEADAVRLNELLSSDAANRIAYLQSMHVIAGLEWERADHSAAALPGSAERTTAEPSLHERACLSPPAAKDLRRLFFRPLSAALCASLATLATVLSIQHWAQPQAEQSAAPQAALVAPNQANAAPVAYLASAIGYSWGEDSPRLQTVGSPVNLGEEVTLQEGVAEFRLSNEVHLSIEGPAGLVLNSPNSVVLQYGKLTLRVPESVNDFKVLAGASRLSASGAEFGVDLAGGDVAVHVFSGKVAAVNASFMDARRSFEEVIDDDRDELDDESAERTGVLTHALILEGRSLALAGDGDAVNITGWGVADEATFASRLPLAEPLPITRPYVDAVSASRPISYWRFESIEGQVVKDETPGGHRLHVFGNVRLVGEADNLAVELGRLDSDGFLAALDPTSALSSSDYSVEVWMRPSHVHAAAVVTLAGKSAETGDERPGFYLGLHGSGNARSSASPGSLHPGSVRFLNRNPPSANTLTGASCFSGMSYQLRRWQHVTAVKEGPAMRLYVNGQLAASGADDDTLPRELRLIVGEASTTQRTYRFRGQLDELALYDRALTQQEVDRHFRAVRLAPEEEASRTKPKELRTIL